jgi:hypothetical protein
MWDALTYAQRYALIQQESAYLRTDKDSYEYHNLQGRYFICTNPKIQDIMAIGKTERPDLFIAVYHAMYSGIALKRTFIRELRQQILVVETAEFPLFK